MPWWAAFFRRVCHPLPQRRHGQRTDGEPARAADRRALRAKAERAAAPRRASRSMSSARCSRCFCRTGSILDIRRTAPVRSTRWRRSCSVFSRRRCPSRSRSIRFFFAMSVQWGAFNGAQGFNSSTIFSTNNTKQTSLALAHYLCEK